ncbi:MAG: phosphoribosylanthranilate isomerase [Saprospiraceae bacterium]|nr:phosphoribosylanthranilate isomerase [Saprospiraceae bacterium]
MAKVKICCIANIEEARLALKYGAYAIGLVGPMPSGPGPISPVEAGNIVSQLPSNTNTFYLTSKVTLEEILIEYQVVKSSHIQLTDATSSTVRKELKLVYPRLEVVQVIHVVDDTSIAEAREAAKTSDALLLDSGAPDKLIKELGGTGRTHNWEISQQIVNTVKLPVYLAGGLKNTNVAKAVKKVTPYAVDLCSGVRTNGKLDRAKLDSFFKALSV